MTKNRDELFQERVDELLLIEKQAEQRAEKFIELAHDYQEKSQKVFDVLRSQIGVINESLGKINAASEAINEDMALCAIYATRAKQLFLGAVSASILIVASTLWWSHHINANLADAKAELAALDIKLKHTPVIIPVDGKDYVRVVPGSEINVHGKKLSGQYAEEWHVK